MKYIYTDNPTPAEVECFYKGLEKYNEKYVYDDYEKFSFVVKNDEVIAGIDGVSGWGRAFIRTLWVSEEHRGNGIGAELLSKVESIAKKRGCLGIQTNTMSFQAKGFYEKCGYTKLAVISNYVDGFECIYYKKEFVDHDGNKH